MVKENNIPEKNFILTNIRVLNPLKRTDEVYTKQGGIVVKNGRIVDVGSNLLSDSHTEGLPLIDGKGLIVSPGLVDISVFPGSPGYAHRENLLSTSLSAAAGGVTAIILEPHTKPVNDNVATLDFIKRRARDESVVHVYCKAALTRNTDGKEMTEMGLLAESEAIAFGDGPYPVQDSQLIYMSMQYAKRFDALIVNQPQDNRLVNGGVMHDGHMAVRLGLPTMNEVAETVMLNRDIDLNRYCKGRFHASLLSTQRSCNIIHRAKNTQDKLSASVSINNLLLTDKDIEAYRTFFKHSPPLRSEQDKEALIEAVANNTIDIITSHHIPQPVEKKRLPFSQAAFGSVGLETLLPASLELYHDKKIDLLSLIASLTINPARIFSIKAGTIEKNSLADFVLFNVNSPYIVDPNNFKSRAKNSSYEGKKFRSQVCMTFVRGRCVYNNLIV